jgi:C_GCAxxG_C_C family probable redox protein
MDKELLEQRIFELYKVPDGLNCAEAVLAAVLEQTPHSPGDLLPRIATCFGSGVGRCKEEMCGALSGGVMAVGCLLGRGEPGGNWDLAAAVAAELRSRFAAANGGTRCGSILERLGPQQNMDKCRLLSSQVAGLLCEALAKVQDSADDAR